MLPSRPPVLCLYQTNTKVELFKVDETLPPEMFAQLSRVGGVRGGCWARRLMVVVVSLLPYLSRPDHDAPRL